MPDPDDVDAPTLASYGAVLATYGAVLASTTVALARRRKLPDRVPWGDLALAAVASNVLTRRITKDKVTRVVRAPFTEPTESGAPGELNERVTARSGPRRVVGELLSCPFCLSQWTSTALVVGLVVAPKQARFISSVLAVSGASDQLQYVRAALHKASDG